MAGPTVNAVAGFGEELGWRGFLQNQLLPLGFWRCSLLIGLIWGVWHAPIILQGHNYPNHPVPGVFMMVAWTVLLAPLFTYVRLKADSVLAPSILHGSLNALSGLALALAAGGHESLGGSNGLFRLFGPAFGQRGAVSVGGLAPDGLKYPGCLSGREGSMRRSEAAGPGGGGARNTLAPRRLFRHEAGRMPAVTERICRGQMGDGLPVWQGRDTFDGWCHLIKGGIS